MNQIVQLLIDKTGLPEDKATVAVDTVIGFLKDKLPAPVGSQIDSLMSGEAGTGVGGMLGGLFGKKE